MLLRNVSLGLYLATLALHAGAQDSIARGADPTAVFRAPAPGQALQAGDEVEVTWDGVAPSAREVELLLSLDGGRHFALRLTSELDPACRSFRWRVPNLTAEDARLSLRMGIGDREVTSAPGPSFRITADRSLPALPLAWHEGELWVDEDNGDSKPESADEPLARIAAPPDALTGAASGFGSADLPRPAGESEPPDTARSLAHRDDRLQRSPSVTPPSRVPQSVPPRI